MRTIIILIATVAIYSTAFINTKCDHVFTAIEHANIEIEQPSLYGIGDLPLYSWPTGLKEGKDLICVKCFHKQKQVLDYGGANTPIGMNHLTDTIRFGACCPKLGWDTVLVTGPVGLRYVHGDSILGRR